MNTNVVETFVLEKLDDGRFGDWSLGVQELVVKEVVPVCASKRDRVATSVPYPTASYHASQNSGAILAVYLKKVLLHG